MNLTAQELISLDPEEVIIEHMRPECIQSVLEQTAGDDPALYVREGNRLIQNRDQASEGLAKVIMILWCLSKGPS